MKRGPSSADKWNQWKFSSPRIIMILQSKKEDLLCFGCPALQKTDLSKCIPANLEGLSIECESLQIQPAVHQPYSILNVATKYKTLC